MLRKSEEREEGGGKGGGGGKDRGGGVGRVRERERDEKMQYQKERKGEGRKEERVCLGRLWTQGTQRVKLKKSLGDCVVVEDHRHTKHSQLFLPQNGNLIYVVYNPPPSPLTELLECQCAYSGATWRILHQAGSVRAERRVLAPGPL